MHIDRSQAERQAAEIIQSWLDGATPDAAMAIAKHPEFSAEKAIVLDLAFAEFLVRELKGEQLDVEEFCGRFPEYHASLGRMLSQQSLGGRMPGSDGALPDGLAQRTVNMPVPPIQATFPGMVQPAKPSAPRPASNPSSAPASGSSPSAKGGAKSWPEAGSKIGDFNLLRQLGKGAFGRVFLALEEPTTRHVVVKISKQRCDEAKVLGRLGHRNVVSVLSAPHDIASGLYLVVMPYLGSATFEDLLEMAYPLRRGGSDRPRRAEIFVSAARRNLRAGDPVPPELRADPFLARAGFVDGVVWAGVRLAEALAAVHRCGFLHHDLKPSNILLSLDGQPRLLDFNLASDIRNSKSRLGGTLPYMPPEHLQAVREPEANPTMDARGDVFSLGVILYELLTGTHPFGRFPKSRSVRTVAQEMLARQKLGVRPIREQNPEVSHRLARTIEKCLAFDPADRLQSASELASELQTCYSVQKKAMHFLGTRPGRAAVMAASIGLVSTVTWMATSQARPAEFQIPDWRQQGLRAESEGRYVDAAVALAKVAQDHPDDGEIWLALGRVRLGQGEWLTAKPDLERAAELRPTHGPTQATLAWCLARLGYLDASLAALARAERAGYNPAGIYALRGRNFVHLGQDREALIALNRALEIDPNNRVALVNRAALGLTSAMAKTEPPSPADCADLDRAIIVGPSDANLDAWAANFYAWAAHKPAAAKGPWYPDPAKAKERCLALLRQAVEHGLPEDEWIQDSTFRFLFGEPAVFARDWVRTTQTADPFGYYRVGNPLIEFAG